MMHRMEVNMLTLVVLMLKINILNIINVCIFLKCTNYI